MYIDSRPTRTHALRVCVKGQSPERGGHNTREAGHKNGSVNKSSVFLALRAVDGCRKMPKSTSSLELNPRAKSRVEPGEGAFRTYPCSAVRAWGNTSFFLKCFFQRVPS